MRQYFICIWKKGLEGSFKSLLYRQQVETQQDQYLIGSKLIAVRPG